MVVFVTRLFFCWSCREGAAPVGAGGQEEGELRGILLLGQAYQRSWTVREVGLKGQGNTWNVAKGAESRQEGQLRLSTRTILSLNDRREEQ